MALLTKDLAEAWLYQVIRPVLSGLRTEQSFLRDRNWTWRFLPARLEYLRPVAEYIPLEQEPTLRSLLRSHPELAPAVRTHDESCRELEEGCSQLQAALTACPDISRLRDSIAPQCQAELGAPIASYFGSFSSDTEIDAAIAQLLVNNIERQYDHYLSAPFWNRFGSHFREILRKPLFQPHRDVVERAGDSFAKQSDQFHSAVVDLQDALSDAHGLPPVPPTLVAH